MRPPAFWSRTAPGWQAWLLSPLAAIWTAVGNRRMRRTTPHRMDIPVICIGNATLGGAGKTPVALDLAQRLQAAGATPHFLSRGYGGRQYGPIQVDPDTHEADDVGDEPLLLARVAPTWVARDRIAGANAAQAAGASHIIMDDGFQNPTLHKDFSFLVIDAGAGFGNGCVVPAGPLRESGAAALSRAQAVILLGDGPAPGFDADQSPVPVLRAGIVACLPSSLSPGTACLAFAGIGRPEKFFQTARDLGLTVAETQSFADHYRYRPSDFKIMLTIAKALEAVLISTEKDYVRIPKSFRDLVTPIPIAIQWDTKNDPVHLLNRVGLIKTR